MFEKEALDQMVPPGRPRPGKYRQGVIQIWLTRACDKSCYGCTQASNIRGNAGFITVAQFEKALRSLKDYWGVIGIFGGNPALHPHFEAICELLCDYFPYPQRGIWCNHPRGKGKVMSATFNPAVSNLNVHLDQEAYNEFARDWPQARPVGLRDDSRHSPPFVAMKDLIEDESRRWDLIANCDINKHWSALLGVFRGELRAWFCEIAGAQSILQQNDPNYPDTGIVPHEGWWKLDMHSFADQVRKHCHECGVPLRGYGSLSQENDGLEYTTKTYVEVYQPKSKDRRVLVAEDLHQIKPQSLPLFTNYLGNAKCRY